MYSIRKTHRRAPIVLTLAAASALAGCWTAPRPAAEEASTEPLVIDEAMQKRDWPQTVAAFQAGGIDAGATRFPYAPQTSGEGAGYAVFGPERSNVLLDTGAFIAQTLVLPFTFAVDPPFAKKNYRGVIYNSTYTAMPLLPPDEAPSDGSHSSPTAAHENTSEPAEDDAALPDLPPGEVAPNETPLDAQPPAIAPDVSEPASAEPVPAVEPEPQPADVQPTPEAVEPLPAPVEPTETAPEPSSTEQPAPDVAEPAPETSEPAPESTEPAPETAPESEPEPAPQTETEANK